MKIIDAHWEERNLGVKSYEVVLSAEDPVTAFLQAEKDLISKGAKYLVVKIPVNCPHLLQKIPQAGYTFIEATFSLALKKEHYVCPPYLGRFDRGLEVRRAETPEDQARVYAEIGKGLFDTDRVSLDTRFPEGTGNQRYLNWIKDLVAKGHGLFEVFSNGKPIGFFQLEALDEKRVRGILTGIYEAYAESGMGALIMKKIYDHVWSAGYRTYYATAVTNNPIALRSNFVFGSQITDITYNYVKHID